MKPDPEFAAAVYEIVRRIPPGRATSYGAIARAVGYPTLSRMVGRVMAGCGESGVPAHRVVNSQGRLTGKNAFGAPDAMQRCLEAEGVTVANGGIVRWRDIFWDPQREILL